MRLSFNHLQRTDPAFHLHYATLKIETEQAQLASEPDSWMAEVKPSENGRWQKR